MQEGLDRSPLCVECLLKAMTRGRGHLSAGAGSSYHLISFLGRAPLTQHFHPIAYYRGRLYAEDLLAITSAGPQVAFEEISHDANTSWWNGLQTVHLMCAFTVDTSNSCDLRANWGVHLPTTTKPGQSNLGTVAAPYLKFSMTGKRAEIITAIGAAYRQTVNTTMGT